MGLRTEEGISEIPRMHKSSLYNLQHARIFDANHCCERISVSHTQKYLDTVSRLMVLFLTQLFSEEVEILFHIRMYTTYIEVISIILLSSNIKVLLRFSIIFFTYQTKRIILNSSISILFFWISMYQVYRLIKSIRQLQAQIIVRREIHATNTHGEIIVTVSFLFSLFPSTCCMMLSIRMYVRPDREVISPRYKRNASS